MTNTIRCPKCASENVVVSKKRGVNFCEDCGHEFVPVNPVAPMRIFLSYGHDSNEELVRRIKADLEKRGHDVWFDKSEIKGGHDWRRSITEGIVDSHRVLSFLSKHSTRDPGVCLDEIAIAIGAKGGNIQTILVESEKEVNPPPSISHIQWLDMHDWKEQRDAGEAAWEKWYQEKLAEIVVVVESDQSRRFAGEIKTLEEYLKPISSDSRIGQLLKKPLVGRVWLFEAIEQWRNAADRASRLFWIMGAPGVGKSAFAAHLTHYGRDKVIAVQFCEYDKPDHRNAQRIVRTLAFQIATWLPDYRKLLLTLPEIKGEGLNRKNPDELFDYLLVHPLKLSIVGGRERYLIVIDALDEAGGNGRNELVAMLARNAPRLPDWIGIVVTSRPESDVIAPLQGLNPFVLDTATESNRADIRDYLRRELASHLQNRPDADRLVEQVLEKSEGVFLYVERFCDDVQRGYLSLDHPEQSPQGLGGIFFQYFQRQFPDLEKFRKDMRRALRAILAAREPLPISIIQAEAGWPEENLARLERPRAWKQDELRDFIRSLGSLFSVALEQGEEVIKPYHKSLADWLANETKAASYFVSVLDGHELLAGACWNDFQRDVTMMSAYSLRYAVHHLRTDGRAEDARIIWEDKRFRRRRIEMGILNLFLCAAWRDEGEFTSKLRDDLITQRFTVWPNRDDDDSAGLPFAQQTAEMIKECDSLILVLSPKSVASNYARHEWRFALEFDKPIFPILRLPDWSLVPDELKVLQCEDFRDDANYDDHLVRLNQLLRQPAPDLAALFGVPSLPSQFLPRPELVSRIKQRLLVHLEGPVVISGSASRVGLHGLGGIGKSVLAAAVVRDREVRRAFPDGVIWVSVGEQPDPVRVMQTMASHLGIREQITTEVDGQVALKNFFADKALLLILDDIRQVSDTQCLSILGPRCRALLTTRDASILETVNAQIMTVSTLSEDDAARLLAEITGATSESLPPEARELASELNGFPLALALCGAYVRETGCTWSDYLARYHRIGDELKTENGTRPANLQITLQRSLDGFSTLEQRRLAELCIAAKDGAVSQEAVRELWFQAGNVSSDACVALLTRLQICGLVLIEDGGQQRTIRIHQLIQDLLRQLNP